MVAVIGPVVALAHGLAAHEGAVVVLVVVNTGRSQIGRAEGRISWPPGSDFCADRDCIHRHGLK